MAEADAHVPLTDEEEVTTLQIEEESDRSNSDGRSSGNNSEDGAAGDGDDDEDDGEANANAGWAEAMANILEKKTSEKKSGILVKNKELEKIKGQERREQQEKKEQVNRHQQWEWACRHKADVVKDRETERALQRIATRGVVQLFNAVRKHQRSMEERLKDVGGSDSKKAKILSSVSKRDFVQCLRGEAPTDPTHCEPVTEDKPSWNVLREDFMMGASMKDWDKQSDEEEGGGQMGVAK